MTRRLLKKYRTSAICPVIFLALVPSGHVVGQDPSPEQPPPEGALFLLLPGDAEGVSAEGVSLGRAMTAATTLRRRFRIRLDSHVFPRASS